MDSLANDDDVKLFTSILEEELNKYDSPLERAIVLQYWRYECEELMKKYNIKCKINYNKNEN